MADGVDWDGSRLPYSPHPEGPSCIPHTSCVAFQTTEVRGMASSPAKVMLPFQVTITKSHFESEFFSEIKNAPPIVVARHGMC